eukprot:4174326-Amphidinium_carterae.1
MLKRSTATTEKPCNASYYPSRPPPAHNKRHTGLSASKLAGTTEVVKESHDSWAATAVWEDGRGIPATAWDSSDPLGTGGSTLTSGAAGHQESLCWWTEWPTWPHLAQA